MRAQLLVLSFLLLAPGCDMSRVPGWWKTSRHPTYPVSIRHPRSWEAKRDVFPGTAFVLLSPEDDRFFRANANLVVQERTDPTSDLKSLAGRSEEQLRFVLNEYRVLARTPTQLGNLPAYELRGQYRGTEGLRLIRTILSVTEHSVFILTLGCRADQETHYEKVFDGIRKGFSERAT